MAKILVLTGSPRRGGNTDTLLKSFIDGTENSGAYIETINTASLDIDPCTSCDGCYSTGECVIDDAMEDIYVKLDSCDALVLASPIYFGGVTAQLKRVIDRLQKYWFINIGNNKNLEHKRTRGKRWGYLLSVGGMKGEKYSQGVILTAEIACLTLNMRLSGHLCLQGYDEKGAIEKDSNVLEKAYQEGLKFAKLVSH